MDLSVLLLPLLGGYLFCRTSEKYRYKLYRYSGYNLFFTCAIAGTVLSAPPFVLFWLIEVGPTAGSSTYALPAACFLGLLAGYPLAKAQNLCLDEEKQVDDEVAENGDILELLLRKSYREGKLIMVTLDSDKVFIGLATQNMDPYGDREYFRLLKTGSGYRTKERHVAIVTQYDKAFQALSKSAEEEGSEEKENEFKGYNTDDLQVVIAKDRVVHASVFHPDLSKYFPNAPKIGQ